MIHETVDIWKSFPYQSASNDDFRSTLDTYILKGEKKRISVLICPGGGYGFTSPREAEPIALQFNAAGFHAFVLYYSVAPNKHPQPLMDVSRAMCILREHALEWNIDTNKIAVCGFSAGGHLAASLGVHWNEDFLQNVPGINPQMNQPNALILSYPVISSGPFAHQGSFENLLGKNPDPDLLEKMSLENQITEKTPPTFLWHTFEDSSVSVENSLLFAQGLRSRNIPFELHIYPNGSHGLSLSTEETSNGPGKADPHTATWMGLCIEWLKGVFS